MIIYCLFIFVKTDVISIYDIDNVIKPNENASQSHTLFYLLLLLFGVPLFFKLYMYIL